MKILTAKYESGTFKENSVVRITYEGQPSNTIVNVPVNNKNTNYKEILEWVEEGNTIEEAD
tara:strand:+ start:229 stop:411 length:183 start_codon:yes stop_codon:yes gene_type:complete